MRTTLTLDDDLFALLKSRSQEERRPFKDVVNETLRAGLERQHTPAAPRARFSVQPFDSRPRLPHVTSTGELLALLDEDDHGAR